MVLRVLLLIGVIGLVWLLIRQFRSAGAGSISQSRHNQRYQRMVACRHCGLHVPEHEAIARGDQRFCCEEHARDG